MTKADFVDAVIRNGWYIPPPKSSIITIKWLAEVKTGQIWVPKYHEVRMRACPTPPSKDIIIKELTKACQKVGKKAPIIAKDPRTAPVAWCLHLLSTVEPGHQFFTKGFRPSDLEKENYPVQMEIDNSDAFFVDLPPLSHGTANRRQAKRMAKEMQSLFETDELRQTRVKMGAKKVKKAVEAKDFNNDLRLLTGHQMSVDDMSQMFTKWSLNCE